MIGQRAKVVVNVGNLLELIGAVSAVYGVARLAGLAYGLILLGVLLVVAAELIYDSHVWRIPLPHRPRPLQAITRSRARVRKRLVRLRWGWTDRRLARGR